LLIGGAAFSPTDIITMPLAAARIFCFLFSCFF
jgi:hypothetical protein